MEANELIRRVQEQIDRTGSARAVFGEAVERDGIAVIPVARVSVSGGGGGGRAEPSLPATDAAPGTTTANTGAGMGFHVSSAPVGFIRLGRGDAQFVRTPDLTRIAMGALAVGALLALMLLRRR
jgi:uncharacterized spore protein YtfJ